jgi:hypothetical protein
MAAAERRSASGVKAVGRWGGGAVGTRPSAPSPAARLRLQGADDAGIAAVSRLTAQAPRPDRIDRQRQPGADIP